MFITIISIVIVVLVIAIIAIYLGVHFKRKSNAINNIEGLLQEILDEHKSQANKFIKSKKNECYDYYLETLTDIYYIKVLYNFNNYEISINSRYKWQYKTDITDEKLRFVEGITEFVNFHSKELKKKVTKLCLIYPNSSSLLYYINESDIAFVRPEEALYGINFITYERLNSNHNLI